MNKLKPYINISPSKFIEEELEERGWSREKFAEILGITKREVDLILSNKQRVTENTAKLLSEVFGQSEQYWINLDHNYNLREKR